MTIHRQEEQPGSDHSPEDVALVLPLRLLDRTWLPIVGGKAANLGELIRAGFRVPDGFCVTTAAYAKVVDAADLEPLLAELATLGSNETTRLASLAKEVQAAVLHAPVPTSIVEAITTAYRALGDGDAIAVAVRSSATAEDLPSASFAGQQETYLNIIGIEEVLMAVRRCFASLWTERAAKCFHIELAELPSKAMPPTWCRATEGHTYPATFHWKHLALKV